MGEKLGDDTTEITGDIDSIEAGDGDSSLEIDNAGERIGEGSLTMGIEGRSGMLIRVTRE